MTDDNNSTPPSDDKKDDGPDPIKQLKSEFSRKHDKQNELLNQLLNTQAQLQEALTKMAAPKQQVQVDEANLDEIMYSDPKKYASIIKTQARDEALAAVRQENSTQDSVKSAIAGLYNDYPELSDPESEITKASVQYLKGASDSEKMNPRTYEYAVLKAAQQLEMQPKSKRKQAEDDFVAPTYTSPASRGKKRTNDQVVSQNKDMAMAFGVDLNDPAQKEKYLNILKNKGVI